MAGIEPATSWSQTRRPTAGPHPVAALMIRADILDDKDSCGFALQRRLMYHVNVDSVTSSRLNVSAFWSME